MSDAFPGRWGSGRLRSRSCAGLLFVLAAFLACASCSPEPPAVVNLELGPDDSLFVQGESVTLEDLAEKLDELNADLGTRFVFAPDASTRLPRYSDVLGAVLRLGIPEGRLSILDPDLNELVGVEEYSPPPYDCSADVKRRIRALRRELSLAADLPPWAGEYGYGDGLGTNVMLLLAPESGFASAWVGCMGLYGENLGGVRVDGARIHLDCEHENDPGGFGGIRTELVQVPWGERRYLVAPEQMTAFGNDVRSGMESRKGGTGLYLLRSGDEEKAVSGLPELPEEFQFALDAPVIEARIVEVLETTPKERESGYDWVRVRLDLGLARGAYREMDLELVEPADLGYFGASIDAVTAEDSLAEILVHDDGKRPEVGWRFMRRVR